MSEAGSGSDAFGMKTTAVKDGEDYIINGNKLWITNSEHAGVFLVFANAVPERMNEKDVRIYVKFCLILKHRNLMSLLLVQG